MKKLLVVDVHDIKHVLIPVIADVNVLPALQLKANVDTLHLVQLPYHQAPPT